MNCYATWEDEENNRQIRFAVDYRVDEGKPVIEQATPTKVSFVCPESNSVLRSIGVWTETGRRVLSDRFHQSPAFRQLVQELARRQEESLELTV
jgi:hypothetical protein